MLDDYLRRCSSDEFIIHGYNVLDDHFHLMVRVVQEIESLSGHLRRVLSAFGQQYNQRHQRTGRVSHDRPRIILVQPGRMIRRCMFYMDCNPVRLGLVEHPADSAWSFFSSCRFYAHGERHLYSDMLRVPRWYLHLDQTWEGRQKRYRSLLDRHLREYGFCHDPDMSSGSFLGSRHWKEDMKRILKTSRKKGEK
jgi:hypothetical protein